MEKLISTMSYPTKIVLGGGAIERVGEWCKTLKMQKPLVVTDKGVVKAGLAERLTVELKKAGVAWGTFDSVEPNPTEKDAFDGLQAYRDQGCDGIVAIGGGSPLDVAKLIKLLTSHEPPLSKYDDAIGGDKHVVNAMPPLIAIPTTAGTGSEVSRSAVALLKDTARKTVIFAPALLPNVAICDPELTYGLPEKPTAWTGMDAFTHCLEAFVATGMHPLADAFAIDGIARASRSLAKAVKEPKNYEARLDMMVSAIEGAAAFQKGLGASHALAHALGAISHVHHGLANAVVLPAVMEFNRPAATSRLAKAAVAMGESSTVREELLAEKAVERVKNLCRDIGIPAKLREVGVKEEDLPALAEKAYEDASHQTNPRKCSKDDLLSLLKAAW